MQNIKLITAYDGTRYQGWQCRNRCDASGTISGKITDVLHKITGEEIVLNCGFRTEAGFHASGQTVNFKLNHSCNLQQIKKDMNHYLPQDIVILSAQEVPERFHAGLNAKAKTLVCRIDTGTVSNVFTRRYCWHIPGTPDINKMEEAAQMLCGKHDFMPFSSGKKKKATEKNLFSIRFLRLPGNELQIEFEADDFLHKMPQSLAGILTDIGYGRKSPDCIKEIFSGDSNVPSDLFIRSLTAQNPGSLCPGHAFCLKQIRYDL